MVSSVGTCPDLARGGGGILPLAVCVDWPVLASPDHRHQNLSDSVTAIHTSLQMTVQHMIRMCIVKYKCHMTYLHCQKTFSCGFGSEVQIVTYIWCNIYFWCSLEWSFKLYFWEKDLGHLSHLYTSMNSHMPCDYTFLAKRDVARGSPPRHSNTTPGSWPELYLHLQNTKDNTCTWIVWGGVAW
jgi:hypothetical protein